jgi:predicted MFS family arabinose efflux permease
VSSPFNALRVRNFRLYFIGQITSNIGTWFQTIAQAMLVLELTDSGKALGILTALQFTPMLLLGMYGGVMADRLKPRVLLTVTAVIASLLAFTLAIVSALDAITIWWVWSMAFALGCVQAFDRPMSQAFLYEMVGPDDLPNAVALNSITQSSARMIGPALGGMVYALFGSAVCFTVTGLTFFCVITAIAAMRGSELWHRVTEHHDVLTQLREGLRYAWRNPSLRTPLIANALIGCFAFNFMILLAAMTQFVFKADATALGWAHALNAVGAVMGSLLIATIRKPTRKHLAIACFVMTIAIGINAASPTLAFFLIWAPIFGFSIGAYQTTIQSSVQGATEPRMMGRVASLITLGLMGTTPIGGLIIGWMIDAWSARVAMATGAVACFIGGIIVLTSLLAARR